MKKMAIDYKDKIRKLLALAKSPVEAEAKAALLKAHQLMAAHKLTEEELKEKKNQNIKKVQTGITASKRRNPWAIHLSNVIGDNFGKTPGGYGCNTEFQTTSI